MITDDEFIEVIRKFQKENQYPPSMRELVKLTPYNSTSAVSYRLDSLQKKGLVIRNCKVARSLRIVEKVHDDVKQVRKDKTLQRLPRKIRPSVPHVIMN